MGFLCSTFLVGLPIIVELSISFGDLTNQKGSGLLEYEKIKSSKINETRCNRISFKLHF